MIARAALLALLLAPASGSTRDDPLAGRSAGPATACLSLDRVQGPEIVGDRTILYRQNTRRIWRTGPVGACSALRTGDTLIVALNGRQLCRGDRFEVARNGTVLGAPCRLDGFVPYDVPR